MARKAEGRGRPDRGPDLAARGVRRSGPSGRRCRWGPGPGDQTPGGTVRPAPLRRPRRRCRRDPGLSRRYPHLGDRRLRRAVAGGGAHRRSDRDGAGSRGDLRRPQVAYFLGHARAVADLVAAAATEMGMAADQAVVLRRAALVHGLGRLGVSNSIWDKRGSLGTGEWERVRMHPYLTERMLEQSPALRFLGAVAGQVRERLDGSGYPRGLPAAALAPSARLLAAADVYQAIREPRPHRDALGPIDAAAELGKEVKEGRLDGDAVRAVLAAAGHRVTS